MTRPEKSIFFALVFFIVWIKKRNYHDQGRGRVENVYEEHSQERRKGLSDPNITQCASDFILEFKACSC